MKKERPVASRRECENCGGEGWLDGLVVGDKVVEQRCGACGGFGTLPVEREDAA